MALGQLLTLGAWTQVFQVLSNSRSSDGRGGFTLREIVVYADVPGRITTVRPPKEGFQGSAIKSSRWAVIELDGFYCDNLKESYFLRDQNGTVWNIDTVQKEDRLLIVRGYV